MRGARQMLIDPDLKAEDQRGAQASGGNNNDNEDHGGDMPSWMFKEESNREKTKKIAPKKADSKKKPSQSKKNDNLDKC